MIFKNQFLFRVIKSDDRSYTLQLTIIRWSFDKRNCRKESLITFNTSAKTIYIAFLSTSFPMHSSCITCYVRFFAIDIRVALNWRRFICASNIRTAGTLSCKWVNDGDENINLCRWNPLHLSDKLWHCTSCEVLIRFQQQNLSYLAFSFIGIVWITWHFRCQRHFHNILRSPRYISYPTKWYKMKTSPQ